MYKRQVLDVEVPLPIQRMPWQEAMDRFGSDKPDLRFGMELQNVSEVVKGCEFAVFKNALENGGSVRGINAKGQGAMPVSYTHLDDLIATGGTVEAAVKMIEKLGGEVVKIIFLMELAGLNGRERLKDYDVESVICYEGK